MKITPIAGSAVGNVDVSGPVHSPSTVERAKAAFAGVQITPSDTPIDPYLEKKRQSIRSIQMKTQVSPEQYYPQQQQQTAHLQQTPTQAAQLNATNPTSEQANSVIEATKPISPQYAALARERRALQVKERELLARQREFESKEPRMGSEDLLSRLKQKPLSVLQEAGVTYDQLTQELLSNPVNPEMQSLKDELKAMREEMNKTLNDRDAEARNQVISEMRREAIALAREGDEFGLIRETRSIPQVISLIERTYDSSGEVLDVDEAMRLVEAELTKDALRLANLNKIKSSIMPKPVPQLQQQQSRPQTPQPMRTLTNRDTATPMLDRKARAVAAFLGQFKR